MDRLRKGEQVEVTEYGKENKWSGQNTEGRTGGGDIIRKGEPVEVTEYKGRTGGGDGIRKGEQVKRNV